MAVLPVGDDEGQAGDAGADLDRCGDRTAGKLFVQDEDFRRELGRARDGGCGILDASDKLEPRVMRDGRAHRAPVLVALGDEEAGG